MLFQINCLYGLWRSTIYFFLPLPLDSIVESLVEYASFLNKFQYLIQKCTVTLQKT